MAFYYFEILKLSSRIILKFQMFVGYLYAGDTSEK